MRRAFVVACCAALAGALLGAPAASAQVLPPTGADAVVVPGAGFVAVEPVRVLDTRSAIGVGTRIPVGSRQTVTVDLSARVPASATAVVLNVTGTAPTVATHITVYPAGTARPVASTLNLAKGETRPNLATVAVGAGSRVSLYNNAGSTHLIADLAGYYTPDAPSRYTALNPARVLDTRVDSQRPKGPVGPRGVAVLELAYNVPPVATAVVLNLTGTQATTATHVTVWPTGTTRPSASNLNLTPGATTPNLVTVAIGGDNRLSLYNNAGTTHLIADIVGFYASGYGSGFVPLAPVRTLDTRLGGGSPVAAGGIVDMSLRDRAPGKATDVVLNLTGIAATGHTYVTAWPAQEPRPTVSALNLAPGQTAANLAVVSLGHDGRVSLRNNAATTHLVADLAGYFVLDEPDCAVDCVYAWGDNEHGQLGTGSYDLNSGTPAKVHGLSGVRAITQPAEYGLGQGYALLDDGTVWGWGDNDYGSLGLGWFGAELAAPAPLAGLRDMVAIDGALGVRADGTVWGWGNHLATDRYGPGQVRGLTDVIDVAAGTSSGYALRADGTVWSWGVNQLGSLGLGWEDQDEWAFDPVQIPGLSGVVGIEAGRYNVLAVKGDGTLWAWGDSTLGQAGTGGSACYDDPLTRHCFYTSPVQVPGIADVTMADAGENGFAVTADGSLYSWGHNSYGSLGIGNPDQDHIALSPVRITALSDVRTVAAAAHAGFAVDGSGRVWAWGDNRLGQLGIPDPSDSSVPSLLPAPAGAVAVSAGYGAVFALVE